MNGYSSPPTPPVCLPSRSFAHALDFGQSSVYISSLAIASIIEFADSGSAQVGQRFGRRFPC
jgi:hypothetical protein